MEFRIGDIPFLECNYQYEKEIHSAYGKPNQKDKCKFVSAEMFKWKIDDKFKDIFIFKDNLSFASGFLIFNKEKMNFTGELPLIKKAKDSKSINFTLTLFFEFDGKKLFDMLYKGKTINITLGDVAGLDALANVKPGDITFNFTFADPSLGPTAIPLLTPFIPTAATTLTADPTNPTFSIKGDSSILDVPLVVAKMDMKDMYKVTKKEKEFKYKIDVQNYLWIKGSCDYKETDDMNLEFDMQKPKFTFDALKKKIPFKVTNKKEFKVNIIHNNSLDDPFNKDPMKECSDPKDFVLDEELEFSTKKSPVKGKYKK